MYTKSIFQFYNIVPLFFWNDFIFVPFDQRGILVKWIVSNPLDPRVFWKKSKSLE